VTQVLRGCCRADYISVSFAEGSRRREETYEISTLATGGCKGTTPDWHRPRQRPGRNSKEQTMTTSTRSRTLRLPALALGALMGATALTAVTPAFTPAPAYAAAVQPGGYVDLVEKVAPAVVFIEVTKAVEQPAMTPGNIPEGFPLDEVMRRFGMPMPMPMPGAPQGQGGEMRGVGTGFIVAAAGQIVTNAHVVDGADAVKVTLSDGRTVDGKVLGTDTATDIALVKVEAGGSLPTVAFGDSTQLKIGQDVVAIGNPF